MNHRRLERQEATELAKRCNTTDKYVRTALYRYRKGKHIEGKISKKIVKLYLKNN